MNVHYTIAFSIVNPVYLQTTVTARCFSRFQHEQKLTRFSHSNMPFECRRSYRRSLDQQHRDTIRSVFLFIRLNRFTTLLKLLTVDLSNSLQFRSKKHFSNFPFIIFPGYSFRPGYRLGNKRFIVSIYLSLFFSL